MSSQNPVFIPGPTNIPERLRHACNVPTIDHRSASFGTMFKPLFAGVKEVLKTKAGEVIMFPATGTAGWEAAISNTLSPGDKVLACRHGMFSHRWIDMCNRHGLTSSSSTPPGAPAPRPPSSRPRSRPTRTTRSRPSSSPTTRPRPASAPTSPPSAGRWTPPKHPALLLVDGVSSIGCMDFRMDEWGVDVAVTGSQKGFMLPTGLAIVGVSPKALAGDGDREAAALLPRLPRHARAPTPRAASPTPRRSTCSTASASR